MQAFRDYVIQEYISSIHDCTSIQFKYAHSLKTKIDKQSKRALYNHTITVTIQFFDKDLNLLHKAILHFVNNVLTTRERKALVNIAPDELNNRFNAARREIVQIIDNEYRSKLEDISYKIDCLHAYEDVSNQSSSIIPSEFRGELVQIAPKQTFDM